MVIALHNLEPKYTNLALEKIRLYYEQQGHAVVDYVPLYDKYYDKIYCSSIFSFTDKSTVSTKAIKGGTGFNLSTRLPPDIENMKPKLNFGFTTRGCIRRCEFCVVPKKEGRIHAVGDIYDLWNGASKEITLLDNNILALPEHFYKICGQLRENKLKVDFNQGLDIRLLNEDMAKELSSIRHKEYRFAFDFPKLEKTVIEKVEMLKRYGIKRSTFYVLCGFNTTFKQDIKRFNVLRELGQNAFLMRYERQRELIPLANWVNTHGLFHKMTFEQFLDKPRNKNYRKEIPKC